MPVEIRELKKEEFADAEKVWYYYRQQKADPEHDRIFGSFINGKLVGVARCKRHPDGIEVDGVFVLEEFRNQGLASEMLRALIERCGTEMLYMHSTLDLVDFYRQFGFRPIPENELPRTIKERMVFCFGDMPACGVSPMMRKGRPETT
jgi:GNAT superfamily N-acetyltransferase